MPVFTPEQIEAFHRDGCLMVRSLYTPEEMEAMLDVARTDKGQEGAHDSSDAEGNVSRIKLTLNPDPRNDVFSALSCGKRMVERIEALMGGTPQHFHHKMMLKDPHVGGAWEWHQDYGYWYLHEKFATPDLISCFVAADRATKANGCLQVIRGSHRPGRIEHGKTGKQTGADLLFVAADRATKANGCLQVIRGSHRPGRIEHGKTGKQTGADLLFVDALLERDDMSHEYVEMEPGDAVFFHSNVLHRSDKNTSDDSRWTLVCCYTREDNLPILEEQRGKVCPIDDIVEDELLLPIARKQLESYTAASGK